WITVTTVRPASAYTLTGVTTTIFSDSMADFYTTNNFTSWRVMQSNVATSSPGVYYPTPFSLSTELATTTFSTANLAQAAYQFETDDGNTIDQNTVTGSVNTALQGVRRGERFNLRISVSSVSSLTLQSKVFQLQYAATTTNASC